LVTAAFALTLVPGFRQPERSLLSRRDQGTALLVFWPLNEDLAPIQYQLFVRSRLISFEPSQSPADKLGKSLGEFETYIRNNIEFIPNFGERCRQGETISTAFVESTINQVVSKWFAKKQQMQCGIARLDPIPLRPARR
jgi:hypothetical protein